MFKNWVPTFNASYAIQDLINNLKKPVPYNCGDHEINTLLKTDLDEFNNKAKEFTEAHAK